MLCTNGVHVHACILYMYACNYRLLQWLLTFCNKATRSIDAASRQMVTLADLDSLLIQKNSLPIHIMHLHLIYKIKYDVAQNTVYTSAVF